MKIATISALATIGVVLLLEHPEILTGGASLTWVRGTYGDHWLVHSYVVDTVRRLTLALILVTASFGIWRRLKQRTVWKRRESMKAIDGGRPHSPERVLQNRKP